MEKDVKLGDIGDLDVKLAAGKVVLTVKASAPAAGVLAGVSVEVDAAILVDKLAELIPGKIDDAILSVVKAALLSA